MKRKIFSKLLMVALVIAAVGSFVSCKDYDDDINNLQKQIDAKAALSELTALQSTLDSKISTATAAAQKAAEDAAAKADASLKSALETAIADAKKAGTDAGTKAGDAITAANKAQETADGAAAAAKKADEDAKAALADALKTIGETYQTKEDAAAALKTIGETYFTIAEAEKLQKQVNDLKADLESTIEEKVKEAIKDVDKAVASVDAIWGTVTSVELVPSAKSGIGALTIDELYFLKGTEVNNAFGAAVAPAGNAAKPYDGNTIAEIKNYKAGDPVKFDNRVVIRVNPANAAFTADDVVLLNSKGESLNNLLTVAVEPYTKLITRGDFNTGLYVVSVTRKADVTEDDFFKAVGSNNGKKYDAEKNPLVTGKTLYAIGINNSKDAAETRYVNTTFDLGVNYGDYTRQNDFTFQVIDKNNAAHGINTLRNRWNGEQLIGEDQTKEFPVAGTWNAELKWDGKSKDNASVFANHVDTLSVSGQTEAKYRNWVVAAAGTDEARYGKDYIVLDADSRTFSIDIDKVMVGTTPLNLVQWYYVTLDRYAAVESAPSEWEAWNSYSYTGLYTVTPAIDRLTVTIESAEAVGDIIGFRVFAVNYDGSLADPDGRAFYVQVGDPVEAASATVNAHVVASMNSTDAGWAYAASANAMYKDLKESLLPKYNGGITAVTIPAEFKTKNVSFPKAAGTFTIAAEGQESKVAAAGAKGKYYLLKDEEGKNAATDWTNFKYIGIEIEEIQNIVDGETVVTSLILSANDEDHHNKPVNKLAVNVTKDMPTGPTNFSWKTGAPITGNTLNLVMTPSATIGGAAVWNAAAAYGWVDLSTYCNNLNANYRFRFADANAIDNGAYENAVDAPATAVTSGKSVYVKSTKIPGAKSVNDAANWLLGIQGPAAADLIAKGADTYVNGTKTSGLKVQYTYATNISTKYDAKNKKVLAAVAPTVDIPTAVTQAKFTYLMANNTYRAFRYETAKTWTTATAAPGPYVYSAGTWNAPSNEYVLYYDGTDGTALTSTFAAGAALQPAIVAPLFPLDNDGTDAVAWRWNVDDAAIVAPGNAWTKQLAYQTAGNRQAIIPGAGIVGGPAAGFASIIQLDKFVIVNNSEYDVVNNIPFDKAMFVGVPTVTFKSDANGVNNEYYDATLNWTGALSLIRFAPKAPAVAIPTVDVPAKVVITCEDAFGHDQVITLPFTIKK